MKRRFRIAMSPVCALAWVLAFGNAAAAGNPSSSALTQAFPNPFAGTTALQFDLPVPSAVNLTVYDAQGREVASVVRGELPAGRHLRSWNPRGGRDRQVPAGVYVVRLEARPLDGGRMFSTMRKLVLLP